MGPLAPALPLKRSAGFLHFGILQAFAKPRMPPLPNLCYTVALDKPGENFHRRMARLLVTSLIRTGWYGRIVVFRNHDRPVLPEGHPYVEEQRIAAEPDAVWHRTMSWKYRLRDRLDVSDTGKVLYLDCDIIALRSINELMMGTWDIYAAPEPGCITEFPFNGYLTESEMNCMADRPGINAGSLGIRSPIFHEVMEEWERLHGTEPLRPSKGRDQHSWNRLMLDTNLRHRHFAKGEIQFPFLHRAVWTDYRRAALVHAAGRSPPEKLELLLGLWSGAFLTDNIDDICQPAVPTVS